MALHPSQRTTLTPPFYHSQVDIVYGFTARPFIKARTTIHLYALVIVCSLTSAVDILALESLETQEVVLAILRHSSRYGLPATLRVDNGSQLIALQNVQFSIQDLDYALHTGA